MKFILTVIAIFATFSGSLVAGRHHWGASARPWPYYEPAYDVPRYYYYDWVPKPWYNYSAGPRWEFRNGCFYYFDGRTWSLGRCY